LLLLKEFGIPKELTRRKLYGVYFHNLVVEGPLQARILIPSSASAESHERFFKQLNLTTNASNMHSNSGVVVNAMRRLHAAEKLGIRYILYFRFNSIISVNCTSLVR